MNASGLAAILRNEHTGEDRRVIVILMVLGTALGALPMAMAYGVPAWLLWYATGSAAIAALALQKVRRPPGRAPCRSLFEYFLATVSVTFIVSLMVTIAAIMGVAVYAIIQSVNSVLGWFHLGPLNAFAFGFWSGAVIAVLFGLVAVQVNVADLREVLYPGAQSGFRPLLARRSKLLRAVVIVVGAAALIGVVRWWAAGRLGGGFWIFMDVYFLFFAAQLYQAWQQRPSIEWKTLCAAGKLFEALGCEVARQPRTGDAAIDPLLAGLDLIAADQDGVWGVSVKSGTQKSPEIDFASAAAFSSAVRAFREKRPEFLGIQPVLLAVDAKLGEDIRAFVEDEAIRLVELTGSEVNAVLSADGSALRAMAEKWFIQPVQPAQLTEEARP